MFSPWDWEHYFVSPAYFFPLDRKKDNKWTEGKFFKKVLIVSRVNKATIFCVSAVI